MSRRHPDGIFAAPYEQGEIGPELFEAACNMGLEGLVSKRADRPYRAGRSKDWIKIKNRKHPAYRRVQDHCPGGKTLTTTGTHVNDGERFALSSEQG